MIEIASVRPSDLWYTVGLIATDGNLSSDGRHVNITSKDTDFLEDVKGSPHLKNKITLKSSGSNKAKIYGFLQFGDVKFYQYLQSIGLTPKKSLTLGALDVPDRYFHDFLRGVIDGDGGIQAWIHSSNGYQQWCLKISSGAFGFSTWVKWKTENLFGVSGRLHQRLHEKHNPLYIIKFGKFAAKIILEQIYYPGCLCLARKQVIAAKCTGTKNGFIKYGNVVQMNNGPRWCNWQPRQT